MIAYPKVDPTDVQKFARAWDLNGIKMILDGTSLQFATDFANVVLRSYVNDLAQKAQAMKAAREKAVNGLPIAQLNPDVPTDSPKPPKKSSIILTD